MPIGRKRKWTSKSKKDAISQQKDRTPPTAERILAEREGFEPSIATAGKFDAEIVPIEVQTPDGETIMHTTDEGIRFDATLEKIASVKLLQEGGVVSAATASQICDGSAAVMVVNEAGLKAIGAKPLARIHQMTVLGHDPVIMLEAPIPATAKALQKAGLSMADIDLYEVNEAFAPMPLAWAQSLDADLDKLNVHGCRTPKKSAVESNPSQPTCQNRLR